MKRNILYACCLLLAHWYNVASVAAQVSNYSFFQFEDNYAPIGGTQLGTASNDDEYFVGSTAGGSTPTGPGFPIGFGFIYNGQIFDRVGINTNGWISFGQSTLSPAVDMTSTNVYAPLASTASTTPAQLRCRLAAFGANLQGQTGSSLSIQTIGNAPSRVCVIQWTNYKRFGTAVLNDALNFQIRLYESSHAIVMVYGTNNFSPGFNVNAQVGLSGTNSTDFNNRTTASDWNSTTAGTNAAMGCAVHGLITPPKNSLSLSWSPCVTGTLPGGSFRRRDIYAFTPAERAQLRDLIVQFILDANPNPLLGNGLGNGTSGYTGTQYHALFGQHGNCNFFPWHRGFIKKLEDYLLKKPGGECFVPLPKWTPISPIPSEFFYDGTGTNNNSVTNGTLVNQNPLTSGPNSYYFYDLESIPCEISSGILCDFSTLAEAEHGSVHVNIGGVMGSIGSAAGAAIFYLWHAYVDDLYWNFESSCDPGSNPGCDLFTRDNSDDYGLEPNPNVQVWYSPDIWVRNTQDALVNASVPGYYTMGCVDDALRHQDPEYSLTTPVYVYVKVRNRGMQSITGAKLRLYFTKSSPGELWPDTWVNNGVNGDEITTGGGVPLPYLVPGDIYTVEIPWFPPAPPGNLPTMYCLLSRIISPDDPITFEQGTTGSPHPIFDNVLNNNNIATKNVYVVNNTPGIVGNSGTYTMSASAEGLGLIQFVPVPHPDLGVSYTDVGAVTVALGGFYTNWEKAMFAASPFIEKVGGNNIRLLSGGGPGDYWIKALLEKNDTSSIHLNFQLNSNFSANYGYRDWNFDLSQEVYDISATGQLPGVFLSAQHYNIAIDYPCEAHAGPDTLILSGGCAVIGSQPVCASCDFGWTENGVAVPGATGPNLQACPTFTSTYVLTVRDTASGCHFSDTVTVYVDRICSAEIGPSQYVIEHGQCVQIGGPGSTCPDCQFFWTPTTGLSNPNISNPIVCPSDDIVYTLTVVRDSFCFAESTVSVQVYHCDGSVDAGPDQTINLGEGVLIGTKDTSGMALYNWYPQTGLDNPNAAQPYATPTETTTYIVYSHGMEHGCFRPASDTVTVTVCRLYYADADGDGYGDAASSVLACAPPPGYVANNADCNDADATENPAALEICNNGKDDNCNGVTDENGSVMLTSGLTGFFPFNGNANDVSPTAINGNPVNTTLTNALNAPNSAYHFNGATALIQAGGDNRGVENEVSVVAWIKTTEAAKGQWVAGKYSFDEDKGYSIAIGNSQNAFIGQAAMSGRDGSGEYFSSGFSTSVVNDGNWHCLVGTAGNGEWKIYVDGVFQNGISGTTLKLATSSDVPFTIGWNTHPSFPMWMNGDIDDVRIYNRVLSACEVDSVCSTNLVSGISDQVSEIALRIFPNPNTGAFTVALPEPAPPGMRFRLLDLTGRLVLEMPAETGIASQSVNAVKLPSGLYLLQVISDHRVLAVKRFVKE